LIRVKFTLDVPAAWNQQAVDELTVWAHVDLETGAVLVNGGHLTSERPGAQPVALSYADMAIAGYDIAGIRRLAVHEAHGSDGACALCARRQALLPGTYCEPCTASDGELSAQQGRELAAGMLADLDALIGECTDGDRLKRLRDLRRSTEALFQDAAARDMRAPIQEASAAE
jgi:hypothetical protein